MTREESAAARPRALIAMALLSALVAAGWATRGGGAPMTWWPSAAVAWALLNEARVETRLARALSIVIATGVVGLWFGVPLSLGLAEGLGDVVGGLLFVRLLSQLERPESMKREVSLWLKALVGVAVSTVAVGALQVALGQGSWQELLPRFASRLAGVASASPLVRATWRGFAWRRLFEREALVVGALLTAIGVVARGVPLGSAEQTLVFVLVMPLSWAALRLEPPIPQVGVFMVAAVSVGLSTLGHGVFRGSEGILGLQSWLVFLSLTTLIAAAITAERRVAFAELAQSEQRFRLMSENGRDLVCVHGLDGVFRYVSSSSTVICGYGPEELIGKHFRAFLHPEDAAGMAKAWEQQLRSSSVPTPRYRFRHKSGRYVWLETTAQFLEGTQTVQSATRDITLRMRTLERLRLACQSAGVVVFDWDLVRNRVVDEGRFRELLGVDFSTEVGDLRATYLRRVHRDDRRRVRAELNGALSGQRAFRTRYRTVHPTKGERHIFASGEIEYDEDGKAVGVIGVNWDVTEQAHVEEELRKARDVSDAASRAKAAYLAMMSHEIRTPLGGIIGLTEALGHEVGPAHKPTVETIRRSGEGLLAVLNDVLDLSKIEAGKLELESRLCELEQLVGDVRSLYWRAAESKGLALSAELDPEAKQLIADPLRLRQVLSNLVSNAVKFTAKGAVAIRTRVVPADARFPTGGVLLEVADTGIGIPEEGLARLFQEFSQVDVSTSRRYGGTGLGLAISKRLVVAMGGQLSVTSVEGQGTTFTVCLPRSSEEALAAARGAVREERVEASDEGDLRGCRVLLAEDNAINRRVAVGLLERLGCVVQAVENGRQAVERWREGRWDVVVMDMQMPELDGLEATRLIRQAETQEHLGRTPIVAMTANAFAEDKDACFSAGMDEVLLKPASRAGLHAALVRLVEGRREAPLRASA